MKPCPKCGGTGFVLNHEEIGSNLRKLRKENHITLERLSKKIGYSAAYLCDLELGRRNWDGKKQELFKRAISQLTKK